MNPPTTKFLIFVLILCTSLASAKKPKHRCEKITMPFCKGLGYNRTFFPNHLNHDTQKEANEAATEFTSLVDVQCSPDIAYFLCSLYAPVCTMMNKALQPCRALCQSARTGCEGIMNRFGFKWPQRFQCEKFPKEGLCVGRNVSSSSYKATKNSKSGKKVSVHKIRRRKCSKKSNEGKFCCKLGRKAAKKGYYCNLKKKENDESRKIVRFRKLVARKCSKYSSCFRSCCEVYQRKRRNSKRNSRKKTRNE